ncbi:unnamed protein product [Notodromas monacha]|uniref:Uncharacterized protein n=1 Tax=Notodromas monacha TaxID=399045 RepID=A0A7R9BLC2_9CRUS|nr:unnamed protein product [Notodromas monacha]CAG0916525.1 unnamed protein product [Notodromas monacha]
MQDYPACLLNEYSSTVHNCLVRELFVNEDFLLNHRRATFSLVFFLFNMSQKRFPRLQISPHYEHGFSPRLKTVSSSVPMVDASHMRYFARPCKQVSCPISPVYWGFKLALVLPAALMWLRIFGSVIKCAAGDSCVDALAAIERLTYSGLGCAADSARFKATVLQDDAVDGGGFGEPDSKISLGLGAWVSAIYMTISFLAGTLIIVAHAFDALMWELATVLVTLCDTMHKSMPDPRQTHATLLTTSRDVIQRGAQAENGPSENPGFINNVTQSSDNEEPVNRVPESLAIPIQTLNELHVYSRPPNDGKEKHEAPKSQENLG